MNINSFRKYKVAGDLKSPLPIPLNGLIYRLSLLGMRGYPEYIRCEVDHPNGRAFCFIVVRKAGLTVERLQQVLGRYTEVQLRSEDIIHDERIL